MIKSKSKLLISMLVLMFAILSIIAVEAIVFALTQQTITTTLDIGYTVKDLDGSVYATYKIGKNGTEKYLVLSATNTNNVSGNKLVFHAADTQNAGSLTFPNGEDFSDLSASNNYVEIKYTYENTGAKLHVASLAISENEASGNIEILYSINGTDFDEQPYAVVVADINDTSL